MIAQCWDNAESTVSQLDKTRLSELSMTAMIAIGSTTLPCLLRQRRRRKPKPTEPLLQAQSYSQLNLTDLSSIPFHPLLPPHSCASHQLPAKCPTQDYTIKLSPSRVRGLPSRSLVQTLATKSLNWLHSVNSMFIGNLFSAWPGWCFDLAGGPCRVCFHNMTSKQHKSA